ncbi:hypothetical protein LCGC14_1251180 [marine sediment metagenome]|uniref:Uncharacterized protein n=1 Tax=marine sediment metagenome TaxID=412755 RepID=A0A0F9NK43_9ZZZZ
MFRYRMEGTEYALVDEHDQIHWAGEEIAVAFTYCLDEQGMEGTLHKHGSPEKANAWAEKTRKKFVDAGHLDMANEIVVVSGKISLEDLNKIIEISGYVGIWYKRLQKEV